MYKTRGIPRQQKATKQITHYYRRNKARMAQKPSTIYGVQYVCLHCNRPERILYIRTPSDKCQRTTNLTQTGSENDTSVVRTR